MKGESSAAKLPWRIELFEEPRAAFENRLWERLEVRRALLLLVRVASTPDRSWSRDELCELIWPSEYPEIARDRLRQALYVLREGFRRVGPDAPLQTTKTHIQLDSSAAATDVMEFSDFVRRSKTADTDKERIAALRRAVEIAQAPFAEGFTEEWIRAIRDSLASELHEARLRLAEFLKDSSEDEALTIIAKAVTDRPLDEQANLLRVKLLMLAGQNVKAKEVAQIYLYRLKNELNLVPGSQWNEFLEASGSTTSGPEPDKERGPTVWHNINRPITRFFGREAEIEWLARAFDSENYRLVTVTGPGGCGKTRLATEYCAGSAKRAYYELYAVGTVELTSATQVLLAFASAIGLQLSPSADLVTEIARSLPSHPVLLFLDNCEHLTSDLAPEVQSLLNAIPNLSILCTSRIRLGLSGERELPLQPLATPSQTLSPEEMLLLPSVGLLVERIQATRPEYRLTEAEAPIVAQLSESLEGIPLAIEIAASRASVMSTSQMLSGLEKRLDFLTSKHNDLPMRHRAMRTALEWSFEDLSQELLELVFALTTFAGSWTQEAAGAVSNHAEIAEALFEIRARSLIQVDSEGADPRYRVLQIVRQFAAERMSDEQRQHLLGEHLKYHASYATELRQMRWAKQRSEQLSPFVASLADFRLAIKTAQSDPRKFGKEYFQVVNGVCDFFESIGAVVELSEVFRILLEEAHLSEEDRIAASYYYGYILAITLDIQGIKGWVPVLMEIALSNSEVFIKNKYLQLVVLGNVAYMAWIADMKEISAQLAPIFNEWSVSQQQDALELLYLNICHGITLLHLNRLDESLELHLKAVEVSEEFTSYRLAGYARQHLGILYQLRGHSDLAASQFAESLDRFIRAGQALGISSSLRGFVGAYVACKQESMSTKNSANLIGFERKQRRQSGTPILPIEGEPYATAIDALKTLMADAFEPEVAVGEDLSLDEVQELVSKMMRADAPLVPNLSQ